MMKTSIFAVMFAAVATGVALTASGASTGTLYSNDFAPPHAEGKPSVKLPEQKNTEDVTVTVLATEDLLDWSEAKLVEMLYNSSDGTWKPADDSDMPKLFFKWRITVSE